jgi:predicted Zn-dependent protease
VPAGGLDGPQPPAPAAAQPPAAAGGLAAPADPTIDSQPLPSNDPMALYEMALSHVAGNRLVEARRLLRASIRIDPGNASAQQRLRQVEAAIQVQADQHLAAAQRAFTYLRYDDAIIEFEQVMQMVPPNDPRYQQAAAGLRRARERLGR